MDNGSEFAGRVMDWWVYENGVELDFSRRGTPTDNAWWKLPIEVAEEVAAVTKALTERLASLAVELNDKA